MKRDHTSLLSLRSRFILWQFVVLMPILIATLLHQQYFMPKFVDPLEEIAEEITDEVLQVKSLQLTLHMSAMPVNDYLIHGHQHEIEDFSNQRKRVDKDFAIVRAAPFGEEYERQLVEDAWLEWGQAKQLAEELLGIPNPVGLPGAGDKMEQFDRHIYDASNKLEELYRQAYEEIKEAQEETHEAQAESRWLSSISMTLALLLSLFLGAALARSILHGLTQLRTGASYVAAGHFDRQVPTSGIHELKELADSFNAMATKLHEHDAMLKDLAIHDTLTGLKNRRAFDTRLHEELQRAERYGRSLSLLMMDIDHFKQVNDSFGHQAGDSVLRTIATKITEIIRPADHAYRYGGEEFAIIAPETTIEGAHSLAERIRSVIENTSFPIPCNEDISITISIGISAFPNDTDTQESLIRWADTALYEAKGSGRNRVCIYNPRHDSE